MIRSLALVAAIALAGPAFAQERPLTDAEVLDLAVREAVWCENWSDETRDCESLYTLRQEADGALISAGMFILTLDPLIQVTVADRVTLQDGRLCSSGSTDELNADDERLYDFESTYRLGTFGSGFLLRPVIADTPDEGQTQL